MTIIPGEVSPAKLYQYLIGAVAPRPICFASTLDNGGNANLSPFSFFNLFGSNPPILIFSPVRRGSNNTIKHTLENIKETGEVVINVVSYAMVQQMSLSSCEYPKGTDEFIKSGFTKISSSIVKPWRVAESPAQLECKVLQVMATGNQGGAGNLVICEVVAMHINDDVLNENNQIDPHKIDLVARMGGDNYCRASGPAVFSVAKPNLQSGIGMDALPAAIRNSAILTGNHLGMLANVHQLPVVNAAYEDERLTHIIQYYNLNPDEMEKEIHLHAKQLLDEGKVAEAWQALLVVNSEE